LWTARLVPVEPVEVAREEIDLAAALEGALAHRAELDAYRADVDLQRARTALARDGVRPALDAVVAYDRVGFDDTGIAGSGLRASGGFGGAFEGLADGDYDDTRVGIVFGIPIGNRAARAAARGAEEAERRAAASLAGARKAVRAEVLDAAAALDTAGQRIAASRAAREAAEIQLAAERDRYAVGLSTNFLVLTRQNDLARARLDEISTLTDYRTARTEMARATGSLLAERGIALADAGR
jgi:outer membrane protein